MPIDGSFFARSAAYELKMLKPSRFSPELMRSIIVPALDWTRGPTTPSALTMSQNCGLYLLSCVISMKPTPDFSMS